MQPEPEQSSGPETTREAAKIFMHTYVLDGWEMKEISKKQPRTDRPEFAAQVGGGNMKDHEGRERTINREQLAVTRVNDMRCFALFDLAEILAEIRDEQRGYGQHTLAAIFEEQERIAQARREDEEVWKAITPIQQKRPVIFRAYQGGFCRNCGEPLGYIEADGGRSREFCDNNGKCRVAYHRKKEREKKREQILQYHSELRDYWHMNGIRGEVLLRLQEILLQHGKIAARAATDVVLVALVANEQAGNNEQVRLIDEIMLEGEAINFEEIKFDDFRIAQGLLAWAEFVSYASTNLLRQLRGYLYERQQHQYYQNQGRKRLEELSSDLQP